MCSSCFVVSFLWMVGSFFLNLVHHIYFMFFFVRAIDTPFWTCEALRACEIMNELGIPRNDAWPKKICKCKLL